MINKLSSLFLGGMILVSLIFLYLMFWPVEIIKPNVQPYKIQTPIVHIGGQVIYVIDACKYRETTAQVSRRFVNGVIFMLPPVTNNVPKGCFITPTSVTIPSEITPGTWYLQLDIEYKVNFLRTKSYHFKTDTFQVIP